jgi:hypothetical protein
MPKSNIEHGDQITEDEFHLKMGKKGQTSKIL